MFKGSLVALITPMRADGSVDEKAYAAFVDWQIKEGTHGVVPVGTTGEIARRCRTPSIKRVVEIADRGREGARAGDRRRRIEQHGRGDRPDAPCQGSRRRCRAGRDAVLQQADAGRHVPALQGDRRCGRSADHHLQHSAAQRGGHERGDDGAAGEAPEHHRREGCDGEPGASAAHATRVRRRISASCRARITRRCRSMRPAATAASASPRTSHLGCAATCRTAWQEGRFVQAMEIQNRLLPLHDALFSETSPAPVKFAASLLGKAIGTLPPAAGAADGSARGPRCARR